MTSPGPDDTTARLRAAANAAGTNRPQLAATLASSDLSHTEIKAVGGFVSAMQASTVRRLATDSGAKTDFTPEELNHLAGIGEQVKQDEDKQDDSRSWFEKATDWVAGALSNTGNALIHNPVTGGVLTGLEWLGNAAHMPFRLLSDGLDQGNNDEIDAQMKARGYDPDSTASYLAFMWNQGESQYHDLSDVRDVYGDDDVDLALKMQADPEQFQADLEKMDPAEAKRITDRLNSQDFQDGAFAAVDQKHISPGRDLARIITLGHTDNKFFTVLSGSLDAAYDWFTDPTLILGKANKVIKAADALGRDASGVERFLTALPGQAKRRAGIADMTDQAGVEALLRTENGQAVTQVGKGWERYLNDARDLRAADAAGDAAKRAGIYAVMQSRYGTLMDLLPEVNGARVISDTDSLSGFRVDAFTDKHLVTNSKPIETLDDLAKHLVSTNGLMRLNNGMAAREAVVMPGRLSYAAERKAALFGSAAAKDTHKAKATGRWIDYARPDQLLPNEAEREILDTYGDNEATRAGLAQRNLLLKASLTNARAFATKVERVRRRFTTQLPAVERLDLTDPGSVKTVENIARFYLNRGDAAKLASAYALAPDLAARRGIVRGVLQQSFHASGLSRSEAGRSFMDRFIADQGVLEKQQYGYEKTSLIDTDSGARQMALYPDQISQHLILPSMREMNYLATKFAVGGFTGRKGLADVRALSQSNGMDQLMGTIKLGWITSAAGGLRNALDEVANFAAYGIGKDVLAARVAYTKATAEHRAERRAASKVRMEQIRTIGRAASDDRIATRLGEGLKSHEDAQLALEKATDPDEIAAAQRQVTAAKSELDQARLLATAISHRLPYWARVVGDTVNDKLIGSALGKAMSVFGKDWAITGERVKWAHELANRESGVVLRDGVFQSHYADTQLTGASDATAMDYHRAGLMARKYKFTSNGYGEIAVEGDGGAGLDAWAKTLGLRFTDTNSPAHSWLQTYRSLPHATPEERAAALKAARDSVRNRLDDEDMRHFVNQAEIFQWYKGTKIAKGDEGARTLAKEEYADRVTADLTQALGGEQGLNETLMDELLKGRVPDRSWLANNVPESERPSHAIGQLWAPYNPAHAPGQINRGYTGMLSKAYNKVVTDQIDALSRNPLTTALYMRARENTKGYVEHLVANGWDREIADDIGRRIASHHAEVEAFKHIDNPYVSSQFSMLARNQFAFVRAQEDWLKRWGRTIKDNPELIRKAQLLIHGGESTGFLEQDDTGALHFVYPGSALMVGLLGGFFGAVGQPNGARIPVQGELSSQIQFLNPSLDNPLGFSGTPLVSLPWKAIAHFMGPDHALMESSIDKVINGDLGAGREWWEQMLPSWANRIIGGVLPTEDMGSKYGAAIQSTIANMEAAGAFDKADQSPEGKARLLHQLQVGTHNDLLATALFGFLLPAAPTYEGNATGTEKGFQGTKADWSAHVAGLRSLKDEARQVFARLPFEEAKAWWQAVHPHESILAPAGGGSRSTVGADAAAAPATIAAASYMEKHPEFFAKYGGKGGPAAYLIPQGPTDTVNGKYSDVAYRAQLELGIRDYKSLNDYFDQIVTQRGFQQYFAEKDKYDAAKAEAGNSPSANNQADEDWSVKRQAILDGNPLLAQRLASNAVDNAATGPTIQSLYAMVQDKSKATRAALGPNRPGIQAMLAAKEQFDAATAELGDRRGNSANRQRTELKLAYDAQINQLAAQYPGLADMARGVFRPAS